MRNIELPAKSKMTASGPQNGQRGVEGVQTKVIGHSEQFLLNNFFYRNSHCITKEITHIHTHTHSSFLKEISEQGGGAKFPEKMLLSYMNGPLSSVLSFFTNSLISLILLEKNHLGGKTFWSNQSLDTVYVDSKNFATGIRC